MRTAGAHAQNPVGKNELIQCNDRIQISVQNSVAFLYTNHSLLEGEIGKEPCL